MDNSTIIKVIQNVHKMIQNRGFDTTKINKNIPMEHMNNLLKLFRNKQNSLDIFIENTNRDHGDIGKKVYVHFIYEMRNTKSTKEIEDIYDTIIKSNNMDETDHVVFVIFNELNDKIRELELTYENMTIFNYKKLMFNLVDHEYVPEHEVLLADEKIELINKFMISDYDKLPLINKTEAVCRYYNFRIGDVIKITRPSLSNKSHVSYRYVQNLH